jgi:HK97 family phage prohead protease
MPQKFVDQRRFRELAAAGDTAGVGVELPARAIRASEENRTVRFVLSDESIDRMGDTLAVDGWELSAFRRNPVVLWAHLSSEPPIGKMVNIFTSGDRLLGDVKFAEPDVYEFSDQIFRLIKSGYIRAGSVGFAPLDWTFSDDRPYGIDFHRQELLEFSIVPVPANANALVVQAVKSLAMRRPALAERSASLSTLSFAGTAESRLRQFLEATRAERHDRACQLRDLELSGVSSSTPEGRAWIIRAHRRYIERTGTLTGTKGISDDKTGNRH